MPRKQKGTRAVRPKQLARQADMLKAAASADTEYARQVAALNRRLSSIDDRFEQEYARFVRTGPGREFLRVLATFRRAKARALVQAGSDEKRQAMEARARGRVEKMIRQLITKGLDGRGIHGLRRRWVRQTARALGQVSTIPAPISVELF